MGLEIANVVITSFLTAIIIAVTIWLGIKQNDLQKKDQKISLFEKRYEIYVIFDEIVHNTNALKDTFSSETFLKTTNQDLLSAFKNACVGRINSRTGEKIKVLNNLQAEVTYNRNGYQRQETLKKIEILEQEIIFTALAELDEKVATLKRSEFLFKKEISAKIIEFSKHYRNFLEICIARHKKSYDEEYNNLINALTLLQPFKVIEEMKLLLDLYSQKNK